MLYLFNSSSRSVYLDNVFATLCLPYGIENTFQYSYIKNNAVDETAIDVSEGEDVLVIYIDKYSEMVKSYVPLRRGELVRSEKMDGRIYYYVKMLDYVHSTNIEEFSSYINSLFKGKIYHKDKKERWNGFLAIRDERGLTDGQRCICTNQESWINTVEALSDRELFKKEYSLFIRFEITDLKGNTINTNCVENTWGLNLVSQNTYFLKVSTYIKDYFSKKPMEKLHLDISDTNNLCGLQITRQEIGSTQTYFKFPIKIATVDKLRKTVLKISCVEAEQEDKGIKCNNKGCYIFASEGYKAYIRKAIIVSCVVLLAVSTWINTLPVNSIINDISKEMNSGSVGWYRERLYNLCLFLESAKYYYSAISSAVITIATVGLIHYYGKPSLQ